MKSSRSLNGLQEGCSTHVSGQKAAKATKPAVLGLTPCEQVHVFSAVQLRDATPGRSLPSAEEGPTSSKLEQGEFMVLALKYSSPRSFP